MATQIIELDSVETVKMHAPLWNSPSNQLRRKIGRYTTVYVDDRCGTVRDTEGKYWDWWLLDNRSIEVIPAV